MKKFFKKPIAIVLAVLIVLSSITAAVYALTVDDDGTFEVYTHWYIKNEDGSLTSVNYGSGENDCTGSLFAKKGDTVVAKLSFNSELTRDVDPNDGESDQFNINYLALMFSYNKTLLTMTKPNPQPLNSKDVDDSQCRGGEWTAMYGGSYAERLGLDMEKTMYVYLFSPIDDRGRNPMGHVLDKDDNGKDYLTLEFEVLRNTELGETSTFNIVPEMISPRDGDTSSTPTFIYSYDSWGEVRNYDGEYGYNLTLNSYSETLSASGTINFEIPEEADGCTVDLPDGGNITGSEGHYVGIGYQGDPVGEFPTVTAPEGSGFKCDGWSLTPFNGSLTYAEKQEVLTDEELADIIYDGNNPTTLYAAFSPEEYPLTFDPNNDEDEPTVIPNVPYGDTLADYVPESNPEKKGSTFREWDFGDNVTMPAEALTVNAVYDLNNYTISYKMDGDPYLSPDSFPYDTPITLKAAPTMQTGYTFSGWTIAGGYKNGDKMPDMNLEAVGSSIPNKHTLTFDPVNGKAPTVVTEVPFGANLADYAPTTNPSMDGYDFKEWAYGGMTTMPDTDVTVVADYNVHQWTLTFKDADGTTLTEETVDYGTNLAAKIPADPSITGKTFKGWTPAVPATMPDNDVVITASYDDNLYTVKYIVDGEVDGATSTLKYGDALSLKALPTKEGYTYSAWEVTGEESGSTYEGITTMPAENITVSTTSEINEWTLTFVPGNNSASIVYENVQYGEVLAGYAPESDPEIEGKTFTGWNYGDKTTMPDSDYTVTATYSDNDYTISYTLDGEAYSTVETYKFGDAFTLKGAPAAKTGFDFSGWTVYEADGATEYTGTTMPSQNLIVKGSYNVHTWTLTFNPDIEGIDPTVYEEMDYGATLEYYAPADPVKKNYNFMGWDYNGLTTMPDNDLTVTAIWQEVGKTTITYLDENHNEFASITGHIGDDIDESEIPAVPAKDGYDAEWSQDFEKYPETNTTVEPVYNAKKTNITITDADGEEIELEVKYDEPLTDDPKCPTDPEAPEGQEFDGWYDDEGNKIDLDKSLEENGVDYQEDINIKPVFKVVDKFLIATGYNADGWVYDEANPIVVKGDAGETYEVPDAVKGQFVNYIGFEGWEIVGAEEEAAPGTFGEYGKTYKAKYDFIYYTLTYKDAEGNVVKEEKVPYGTELAGTIPADIAIEGKVFKGWLTSEGADPNDYKTMPIEDLVFVATYEDEAKESYVLTYTTTNALGQAVTYETYQVEAGAELIIPEDPTKLGSTFAGWLDADGKSPADYAGMPENDLTFAAQWESDMDYAPLIIGGVVVSGAAVGAALAANAALVTGAAVVGGAAVIGGVALAAKYTHKVSYYVDGELYRIYYLLEGTKVITPKDPSKNGATFTGWDKEIPDTMPDHDLTFNATFDGRVSSNVDGDIPNTGSTVASVSAFAIIASAAAAAYVLSTKKKKED